MGEEHTDGGEYRALLDVRDLHVTFDLPEGPLHAVRGASFSVPQGGTLALVGESGSGKSVVSQAIMRILPKVARIAGGQILFDDPLSEGAPQDIAKLGQKSAAMRALRGGRISIIFQEPMTSLSPVHTVGDQVSEALALHRNVSAVEAREITLEMLRLVGFPNAERAQRTFPFELSGGLRQRAMIAMALVCRPALLIADEPTTALDVTVQAQILKLLRDLQAELGMAVLLITHDLGVVANVAEEVVVMYRGQIMEAGGIDAIFEDPQHPYLKALLRAVPRFHMKPGERLVPLREIDAQKHAQALRRERKITEDRSELGQTLLSIDNLTRSFTIKKSGWWGSKEAAVKAVDDVTFTVKRGECLGLVGESGCGKTTVSKLIMRALEADGGSVTFHGRSGPIDVLDLEGSALTQFRRRIQYVFQDPYGSLNPRMRVAEIVGEPLMIHEIGSPEDRRQEVETLLGLVGLDISHLRRYPHSFSGGQRQRIGIARALALHPDLLICDEPVSALDVSIQAQVLNLLKDLKAELGLTYLFISHNLAVVDYIADRIAVMCQGKLVEVAPRESLFSRPVHPYTQGLLKAVPEPSLEHPLDYAHLMDARASDPEAWPAPFTAGPENRLAMVEIAEDHFVRADPAGASGLAA